MSSRLRSAAPRRKPRRRRRVLTLLCMLCLLFTVVVVRLGHLQVLANDPYVELGESQRVRPLTVPAARGSIFDRHGEGLALSVPQKTAFADPRLIGNPAKAAIRMAPILGVDELSLRRKLSGGDAFVYLGRQLPDSVAEALADLNIRGVGFLEEPSRHNPAGALAHGVLGSVNVDGVGISGLELQYDDVLAGTPGQLVLERDPDGRTIPAGKHRRTPAEPGEDLVLTIDRGLQFETERVLADQVMDMGARGGMAIVSNPGTGEILTMASVGRSHSDEPPRPTGNNTALTTVFEPGSANKVITVAGALEEGILAPQSSLSVPGSLVVGDHRFRDHDWHPETSWSVTDILATSSNVGTIKVAKRLGAARLDDYVHRFGFGKRTSLRFPHESPGILLPLDDWSGTSLGSIPLGQGIAVTAMQMLGAYNVFANGGMYVAPKLVAGRVDAGGEEHSTRAPARRRVVSRRTAEQLRDMMVAVVQQGTGQQAEITGYTVAGKTGTARKPQPTGGYQDSQGNYSYVATFAGFVPAEDPKLSVIVVIDEPSASIYAGSVSAPAFARITSYALRQLRIPPASERLTSSLPRLSADAAGDSTNELPAG